MLENIQGDSWGSIPPLHIPSLLPHALCHGRSSSCWLPAFNDHLLFRIVLFSLHVFVFLRFLPLQFFQISRSVMSDSLQPHGLQHARPPCQSPILRVYSNSCPLSQWYNPTTSSTVSPSPAFNHSKQQGLFKWVSFSHQVAKVSEFQFQHQSFQWIFRTDFL